MIKIKRNVKRVERRKLGIKRSSKSNKRAWVAKFRSKSEPLRKSPPSLRNGFVASKRPLQKFSQLRRGPLAHECHFASSYTRFAAAKWLRAFHALRSIVFVVEEPFERVFRSCETTLWHTSAISQPCTLISQLRNGCEILHALKSFSAHIMKPYHHWTHFDHFLKFISYIPYSISKLGNSGVQSFKRCSI